VTVPWLEIGHVRVAALLDSEADLSDPIVDWFPDMPPERALGSRDTMPGIYGAGDRWHMFVRGWLVVHPEGVLLVDTGVGGPRAPAASWFPQTGKLPEALREAGSSTDQVDTVVITHVHDDHLGGAVTDVAPRSPTFGNARYMIQETDLDWLRRVENEGTDGEDEEARVFIESLVRPLEDAGALDSTAGHRRLTDAIELRHTPGHTPGHQIVRISSRGRRLLITGDVFNHPAQVARPDLPSGSDHFPSGAARARRSVLAEVLSHPGTMVAPSHFDEPFGVITSGTGGFAVWRPMPA
jgi:glyoxylase-like metal-dependent hydrolase (beta-lactamase superfamily II)